MTRHRRILALLAACVLVVGAACSGGNDDDASVNDSDGEFGDPGDCIVVDLAVSSEKAALMTELAGEFNGSDAADLGDDRCAFAYPRTKASGRAAQLLSEGWDESSDGPLPVVWSPAASSWGAVVNQRLAEAGEDPIVGDADPFMQTPLVIAMPEPMADALGYPEEPIGWADIIRLAQDPQGWAAYGHPEWGQFRLGKTNPNFSTSGLSALIAQTYASAGKTEGLSSEDLGSTAVIEASRAVESAVVHYGDTTLTFLNNWYRTDQRGTSLTYVSAAAVEEKSVIDYNRGNPDGNLDPGERPEPPEIPLVAIYPEEGSIYSDNPFIILDAEWVTDDEREAAEAFEDFVKQPANQEKVLEYGFRPGNPDVAIGDPIVADYGVDATQPSTLLEVPEPQVLVDLLDDWAEQRKGARVTIVLDVSGSMGDAAGNSGSSKLELAIEAAKDALDQFKEDDLVGLRVFTTGLGPDEDQSWLDLAGVEPLAENRERLRGALNEQYPRAGTPLYEVIQATYDEALADYDPLLINAIVVLTDGVNEDLDSSDDEQQLDELVASITRNSSSELSKPIRIFPIAYGSGADTDVLEQIAEASNATAYDASDPESIDSVFAAVISNF